MPRRSRSNTSKASRIVLAIITGAAVIAALVFGKFFLDKRAEHFSGINELSVADLKESGTSLSGNEYRITGEIAERRNLTGDRGLLISVKPESNTKDSGIIPIHVPPGVDSINLERGHHYSFKVEIDREGLPVALDIKAL